MATLPGTDLLPDPSTVPASPITDVPTNSPLILDGPSEQETVTLRPVLTSDAIAARVREMTAGRPAPTYAPATAVQPLNVGFFQLEEMRTVPFGAKAKAKQRDQLRTEK